MGGNLSLLYLGQQSEQFLPQLKGAVAFSVPVDLEGVSMQLSRVSNTIYMKRFLRMLHQKVKDKMVLFPFVVFPEPDQKVRKLRPDKIWFFYLIREFE